MDWMEALVNDSSLLAVICDEFRVQHLSIFGSAIRGELGPDSDIDLLVEFESEKVPGLLRVAQLELRLSEVFGGREIDVRTYEDLSRYFRDEVRDQAVPLYDAA